MNPHLLLALGLLLVSGCATQSSSLSKDESNKEKRKRLLATDGAAAITTSASDGTKSEYMFTMTFENELDFKLGENELAKNCEQQAFLHAPDPRALDICDTAIKQTNLARFNKSALMFNKALILFRLERDKESFELLLKIREDDPEFVEADYEISRQAYLNSDYRTALKYASYATEKPSRFPSRAYYILGKSYEADFKYQEARIAYQKGLKVTPNMSNLKKSLKRLNRLWPEQRN